MAKQYIMAIGLKCVVNDKKQEKELPAVKAALHKIRPSLIVSEIDKDKAAFTLEKYEDAEKLIRGIYKYSLDRNDTPNDENELCFRIILMVGDSASQTLFAKAVNLVTITMSECNEQSDSYPVQVYITEEIYENLTPRYRDLYHSAIEVGDTVVHQRFSEQAQRCFVVSPIGAENTEIRKRADLVFERYIKPACETTNFVPVRGEMMRGNLISPEIMEALQSDPMVVVYIGSPKLGWNPNVMIELGARILTGAPYLIIKDITSDGKPYDLPFDLKDNRVVDIPEQEEKDLELGAIKIRTIRDRIKEISNVGDQWNYLYPGAAVEIKIGDEKEGASRFTDVSKKLETLFELKGIAGREVSSVIDHLLEKMPSFQIGPFNEEQANLVGRLLVPANPRVSRIHATVPIVFQKHHKYQGRAFLPIIVSYSFNRLTNILRLRILYIDVTSATKLDEQKGYYICSLTGNGKIDLDGFKKP
jgi:hypothetical protein